MKRHKAFKFELNPTKSQRDLLNQTFVVNRQFWNHLVYSFNNVFRNEYNSRRSSYDLTDTEETNNEGKLRFPELSFEVGVELVKFKTNGEPNIMFGF